MEEQFEKLRTLRNRSTDPAERRKIFDAMIPLGTYDQLSVLLAKITSQTYRAKIIDRMIPIGSYEQLRTLRNRSTDTTERKKIFNAMIPLGTYDQLSVLLAKITSQTYRTKIIDRMIQLTTEGPENNNKTERVELPIFSRTATLSQKQYDVFIAHASEDKDFATPLATSLRKDGFKVWYDDFVLKLGDSLQQEIDKGLATSRYGIVILSHNFFNKDWTRKELDGLAAKERVGRKVILPIWRNITKEEVAFYSPTLAGLKAAPSRMGITAITKMIIEVISP